MVTATLVYSIVFKNDYFLPPESVTIPKKSRIMISNNSKEVKNYDIENNFM